MTIPTLFLVALMAPQDSPAPPGPIHWQVVGDPLEMFGHTAVGPTSVPLGSKFRVENPIEKALAPAGDSSGAALPPAKEWVQPGLVAWHADLAAAQEAARKSGKPVMLFQLLGDLDDAFC